MPVATKAERASAPGRLAWIFKGDNLFGYLMMAPVIGVLIMFFAYPLFYEVYSSFTDRSVGHAGKFIGLKNYIFLFEDPTYIKAAINTVVYVSAVQIGKFILGLGIALLLQQKLFGRGIWRALVLVPYAMPGFVAYMVWKLIYNPDVGALNIFLSQIGVIDTHVAFLSDGRYAMQVMSDSRFGQVRAEATGYNPSERTVFFDVAQRRIDLALRPSDSMD